jgi:hypothetical protein
MTVPTKSGLSNEAAVDSNVASENDHRGDHSLQSCRVSSRRYRVSPARPRSLWNYHWYQFRASSARGSGVPAIAAMSCTL